MKVYQKDLKPTKKELKEMFAFKTYNAAFHYSKTEFKCANCHTVYDKKMQICPHCKALPLTKFTKRKKNYEHINSFISYRKEKDHIIELMFIIDDWLSKDGELKREIYLMRKSEYRDKVKVMVREGLYISNMSGCLCYGYGWSLDKPEFYEESYDRSMAFRASWNNVFKIGEINKEILLEHSVFKYIYNTNTIQSMGNRGLALALKYPKELEMLLKHSRRYDKYNYLASVKRYSKTYRKYFDYFEKHRYMNPRLLQVLSKIDEKIELRIFMKFVKQSKIPKELKTADDLRKYSRLISSEGYFNKNNYDDYLRMAADRGQDINSDKVKYNKNWRYIHDAWAKQLRLEQEMKKEAEFSNVMNEFRSKEYSVKKHKVLIEVPRTIKDLFTEADKLGHCVSGYSDRIIKRTSLIVFVREEPGKPFITCEIKNNKIAQMRGKSNFSDMVKPYHRIAVNRYIKEVRVN